MKIVMSELEYAKYCTYLDHDMHPYVVLLHMLFTSDTGIIVTSIPDTELVVQYPSEESKEPAPTPESEVVNNDN